MNLMSDVMVMCICVCGYERVHCFYIVLHLVNHFLINVAFEAEALCNFVSIEKKNFDILKFPNYSYHVGDVM